MRSTHSPQIPPKVKIASAAFLALVLTLIIGAQALAAAPSSALADQPVPVRVTQNSYPDGASEVSGDRIVWLGATDAADSVNQQVFTWTPTGGVVQLSVNSHENEWPMVSGDRVVWYGLGGTDGGEDREIFMWTSATGLVQLTTDDVDQIDAHVSNDRVVWIGADATLAYQVYQVFMWTPSGGVVQISADDTGAISPAVSGGRIAWVNGQDVVYTWTQASGPVGISILEDMGSKLHLHVSGDRLAYESEQHVWTWTPAMDYAQVISEGDSGLFDLSGDRIVWQHWNGTAYELITWTPTTGPVVIATGGSQFFSDCRVSGERVVWPSSSSDTSKVLTWTPGDGVTEIAASSWGAVVSGDRIVWCSGEDSATTEIYTAVYAPTTPPTLPAAPTALGATALSTSSIRVNWTDNSTNELGFFILHWLGGNNWEIAGTVGPNATSYTVTGLSPNTIYVYIVGSYNAAGESWPAEICYAATNGTAPAKVTGLTADVLSSTSIKLDWTDNSNNEWGFLVLRWNGTDFELLATADANATTYTDTGLTPDHQYAYFIAAVNNTGGEWSDPVWPTTLP